MTAPDLAPAFLAAALAVLLAAEMLAPPPQSAPTPVSQTARYRPAASAPDLLNAQAVILARPLFRPDRRPLRAAQVVVDETVPRLSAIVITGAGRSAIFIDDSGAATVLRPGDRIGAYQLQSIAPDSVRLSGPNGARAVTPSFAADVAPPPAPAAPLNPNPPPVAGLFGMPSQ